MYREVHIKNIPAHAHTAEIADLLARFEARASGEAGAPHEAFADEVMARFGGDLTIVAPTGSGDYVYLHCGADLSANLGCDRIGTRVSAMTPQVARFTIDCFDRALATGEPAYTVHRAVRTTRVSLWERLIMPTTTADGRRLLIVFCRPLEYRDEIFAAVLETSPAGIVAVRALRDAEGTIERASIVTANRRAAEIASDARAALLDTDPRESLPFLADPSTWRRCLYVIELRRDDRFETHFEREGREIWLQLAVAPLGDGLVMTMTDISELKLANLALQSRAATLALEIGRERATRRALATEIDERELREKELRRLAEIDPLTELLNRRSLTDRAREELARLDVEGGDFSVIIIDLDHFKQINDSYGHAAGDQVIRNAAALLLESVRPERDLVGRFGGEEFVICLMRTGGTSAARIARRLLARFHDTALMTSAGIGIAVTASLGVATRRAGEDFSALLDRADRALYEAKRAGRDRIRVDQPGGLSEAA